MRIFKIISFGIYLLVLARIDLKKQKVKLWILFTGLLLDVLLSVLTAGIKYFQKEDLWMGVVCGVVFLVISWLTEEKLGFADSIVILSIFLHSGFEQGLVCVAAAFFLAGIVVLALLIASKVKRDTPIPFLPYLFVGYAAGVIAGI